MAVTDATTMLDEAMIDPVTGEIIDQKDLGHDQGETPIADIMGNAPVKTGLPEIGPIEIEVPRDRDGSIGPVIVPKRKRRLNGADQIVLSLTARALTGREIALHEIRGDSSSARLLRHRPRVHLVSDVEPRRRHH